MWPQHHSRCLLPFSCNAVGRGGITTPHVNKNCFPSIFVKKKETKTKNGMIFITLVPTSEPLELESISVHLWRPPWEQTCLARLLEFTSIRYSEPPAAWPLGVCTRLQSVMKLMMWICPREDNSERTCPVFKGLSFAVGVTIPGNHPFVTIAVTF